MRPAHGARANETEVPAGFGQRVCREVTWACAQCPVARTGLLAADCDVKEHLLCDFGALLLLLCQRGAGDERQQRKADQKRVRRSHFSVRLETTPLTWTKKKTRRWHEMSLRLLCLAVLAGSCLAYLPVQGSCFEDPSQASCR